MKHLLALWEEAAPLFLKNLILLCLDYDGTLVPIAQSPGLAKLNPARKKMLEKLSLTNGVKIVIVSGRRLEELKEFVGIPGLIYVGNHGFELEGPAIRHVHPGALAVRELLQKIFEKLEQAFQSIPGIFVENKIFTLSVHYRKALEENSQRAQQIFSEILQPYGGRSQVIITEGKKVWEVRPSIQWNKGTMLLWLLGQVMAHHPQKVLPVYIGDDQTDEDAFKAIHQRGIGIKVTEVMESSSKADYYLRSVQEVYDFLKCLEILKREKRKAYAGRGNA